MKTFSIKTLGCKLNQYDSTEIAGRFIERGWAPKPFGEMADVVIINTCTVTDKTDKKCRGFIRKGAGLSATGRVIVTGCMAVSSREDLNNMPEVDNLFVNSEKDVMYQNISDELSLKDTGGHIDIHQPSWKAAQANRTRGFIKIQNGCDSNCSYCIIPSVRGRPESRCKNEILDHARQLIDEGFHELVLTGITIGKYSSCSTDLPGLLKSLVDLKGEFRIRVTSIEPNHVSDGLLDIYQSSKICNHIHLPLQSGSGRILELMNRNYTIEQFRETVERVKKRFPGIAIGTDIIIGFPGEEDIDFMESESIIRWAGFSYVHQFPFSVRKGTTASLMYQNASDDEISARVYHLRNVSNETGLLYRNTFLNHNFKSVLERGKNGKVTAITDNYLKIDIKNCHEFSSVHGSVKDVMLTYADKNENSGIIVNH